MDVGPTIEQQLALDPFTSVIQSETVRQGVGLIAVHTTTADLYTRQSRDTSLSLPHILMVQAVVVTALYQATIGALFAIATCSLTTCCADSPFEMNEASAAEISLHAAGSTKFIEALRANYVYFKEQVVTPDTVGLPQMSSSGNWVTSEQITELKAFDMMATRNLTVNTSQAECSCKDDETMIRARIVKAGGFELLDRIIFEIRKKLIQEILEPAGDAPSLRRQKLRLDCMVAQVNKRIEADRILKPIQVDSPDGVTVTAGGAIVVTSLVQNGKVHVYDSQLAFAFELGILDCTIKATSWMLLVAQPPCSH